MSRKIKHVGRANLVKEIVKVLSLPEDNDQTLGYFTRMQLVELKIKILALIEKADKIRR